jgi:hypothetical protein
VIDAYTKDQALEPKVDGEDTEYNGRLERSFEESYSPSRKDQRLSFRDVENERLQRPGGSDPEENEHHLRGRHPKRVPRSEDIDNLETQILEAFKEANPKKVWGLVQQLITLTQEAITEAARARFQANFGSDVCKNCEGLKAGSGVVSTCFQVERCYYTNIKATDVTPKQERLIEGLLKQP